jgi:SRSO17 transposase
VIRRARTVQTREEKGHAVARERLVVIRSVEKQPHTWYVLSNAQDEVPLAELVRAHASRHRIEELFAEGNGEVGLDHCEMRSWLGWNHHVTLSLLALWLMQVERRRLEKKLPQ